MQKVILCLVRPVDGEEHKVNTEALVGLFQRFGTLSDVRIFERRVLIKVFVEFEDRTAANLALRKADNSLTQFGNLKLYPSKKNRIMRTGSLPFTEDLSQDLFGKKEETFKSLDSTNLKNGFSNFQTNNSRFHCPVFVQEPRLSDSRVDANGKSFLSTNHLSEPPTFFSGRSTEETGDFSSIIIQPCSQSKADGFRVIIVNRLCSAKITHNHLINLFSCYGTVLKVLINSALNFALVEFETAADASFASTFLKSFRLFGCLIKAKISKYPHLSFRSLERDPSCSLKHFYTEPSKTLNKRDFMAKPVPPQPSLAFYNCPVYLTPQLIKLLVADIHEPSRVMLQSSPSSSPNFYRLDFPSVEKALDVLATLDRQLIDDRRIAITFVPLPDLSSRVPVNIGNFQ